MRLAAATALSVYRTCRSFGMRRAPKFLRNGPHWAKEDMVADAAKGQVHESRLKVVHHCSLLYEAVDEHGAPRFPEFRDRVELLLAQEDGPNEFVEWREHMETVSLEVLNNGLYPTPPWALAISRAFGTLSLALICVP